MSQKTEVPVSISLHGKDSAARRGKLCGGHPTHPHSQQDQAPTLCGCLCPCLTSVKTEAGTGTICDPELRAGVCWSHEQETSNGLCSGASMACVYPPLMSS